MPKIVLELKHNQIRGISRISSHTKAPYYSFLGIPYAKKPTRKLRFQPPVSLEPWTGIYDATEEKDDCLQPTMELPIGQSIIGSEDCLYLNIHTPTLPSSNSPLKPVIALIHGGAFIMGRVSEKEHGYADYIMDRGVIYVVISFRLHILGFLDLGIPECPGNVGIKDVVQALQWIKDNIEYFAGDPNNVTLMGYSAGAAITHFLLISPSIKEKNLYHKAIINGGFGFQPCMSYQKDGVPIAFKFGKFFNYHGNDPMTLLKILRKQSVDVLLKTVLSFEKMEKKKDDGIYVQRSPFLPTIEKIKEGAIFFEDPRNYLHTIKPIPLVIGLAKADALLNVTNETPIFFNKNLKNVLRNLFWFFELDEKTLTDVTNKVQQHYFGEKRITLEDDVETFIRCMYAELYETTIEAVCQQNPTIPVYAYQFEYEGRLSVKLYYMLKHQILGCKIAGACHYDDFFYWSFENKFPLNAKEYEMVDTISTFWSNFAKYGNPNDDKFTFQWKPSVSGHHCYLNINDEITMIDGKIREEELTFWINIFRQVKESEQKK